MHADRGVIAALGAALAALTAVSHPELIPALTLAVTVWAALAMYFKL
ncbi:hypothetical protein AB0B79_06340 [Streptomyces sp. NPDC039022]